MSDNNDKKINVEIDYDKLAKAIVKAQKKAEEQDEETETSKKGNAFVRFWKNVGCALTGKYQGEKPKYTNIVFGSLLMMSFVVIGVVGLLLSAFGLIFLIMYAVNSMVWVGAEAVIGNILQLIMYVAIIFIVFLLSVAMIGAGREAERIKDKNYIVGAFSAMVSLVALVISMVALLR